MGKKNRSKSSYKDNEKPNNRFKKDLLQMAASLVQICMQNHTRQEEWEYFVNLHKAVDQFKKKQKQGHTQQKEVDRSECLPRFMKWLDENGASYCEKIEVKEISKEQGFGFIATQDIKENDVLTTIPEKVILKFEDAKKSYLGRLIDSHEMLTMMPNVSLALFLHCEKNNDKSFFKPYLDLLPADFNTTLYFTPNELKYLKGSTTLGTAIQQFKAIVRQFAIIFQLLNTTGGGGGGKPALLDCLRLIPPATIEKFDFDAYRWAVSAVTTRQNKLPPSAIPASCCSTNTGCCGPKPSPEDYGLALVPLWDMFNHNIGPMTTQYNDENKSVECFAMSDFGVGEQVTICYGSRPNYDLLVHNGFVVADNLFDKIKIPFGISNGDRLYGKRAKLLARFSIEPSSYFTVGMMSSNGQQFRQSPLVAFLRIFHMDEDELDLWMDSEDVGLLQQVECEGADMMRNERAMWKFFSVRLALLKRGIQKMVETASLGEVALTERAKLSIRVREEEMKILDSCVAFSQQHLSKLDSKNDEPKKDDLEKEDQKKDDSKEDEQQEVASVAEVEAVLEETQLENNGDQ